MSTPCVFRNDLDPSLDGFDNFGSLRGGKGGKKQNWGQTHGSGNDSKGDLASALLGFLSQWQQEKSCNKSRSNDGLLARELISALKTDLNHGKSDRDIVSTMEHVLPEPTRSDTRMLGSKDHQADTLRIDRILLDLGKSPGRALRNLRPNGRKFKTRQLREPRTVVSLIMRSAWNPQRKKARDAVMVLMMFPLFPIGIFTSRGLDLLSISTNLSGLTVPAFAI